MANVNSLTSSASAMNLYGSKNVLTGLASGLDTEAMIENSVSGYQTKITQLEQKQTKIQWQQDGFREIIDMASSLTSKYTSYTSSTNLMSAAFFNSASNTSVQGTYANMVSAQGTSTSTIKIDSVTQMASAASYGVSLANIGQANNATSVSAPVSLDTSVPGSKYQGTFDLYYGVREGDSISARTWKISVTLTDSDVYDTPDELADIIKTKLQGESVVDYDGNTVAADDYFEVSASGDSVVIGINSRYDVSREGDVVVRFTPEGSSEYVTMDDNTIEAAQSLGENLANRRLSVTVDGVTSVLTLDALSDPDSMEELAEMLNRKLQEDETLRHKGLSAESSYGGLTFSFRNGQHSLQISAAEGEPDYFQSFLNVSVTPEEEDPAEAVSMTTKLSDLNITLSNGWINGKEVDFSGIDSDSTLQDVLKAINDSDAGVTASFSKLTNQIYFVTKEVGGEQKIEFEGDLADVFGTPGEGRGTYQAGKDAVVSMTVNGTRLENQTFSTNTIDMDGMTVTLKGTFETSETETSVTFGGSANSDKIVDAVKSFVEDYNKLITNLRTAYTTQPGKRSNGSAYDPLTEKDKQSMSESAIKSYEENAKQGLLFADGDLSAMYSKLVSQLGGGGEAQARMAEIGLTTSYKDGLTTLALDENKLRTALEGGLEKVKKVFTDSSYGANDGIMGRMKSVLDAYASTSSANQGILVKKAGTKLASYSLTNNTMQKQIDSIQTQIERWQVKISNRIDYFTKQFSKLEQLMNTMNNQSSMLAGMMGG